MAVEAMVAMIQPGKIGDVIICLPIAKYFHDRGWRVVWPVTTDIFTMVSPAVDYVKFLPVPYVDKDLAIATARRFCPDIQLVDTYFGFLDAQDVTARWQASGISFDRYKYEMAGVPFAEKDKLVITRDVAREMALYNRLNQPEGFRLLHQKASDGTRAICKEPALQQVRLLNIKPMTESIFDWLTVMEKADELHFIDSCFANLASQLHIGTKCFRYYRPGYEDDILYPVLNEQWLTIK